jgi:hypothetical protein
MLTRVDNYALSFTFLTPEKHDKENGQLQRVGEFTGFQMHKNSFYAKICIVKRMFTFRLSIGGLCNFAKNNVLYDY